MRFLFLLPAIVWITSLLGTGLVLKLLTRARVMDTPNTRSNHKTPVPRGGGIAMMGVALAAGYCAGLPPRIVLCGVVLGAVSFMDDVRDLPAALRFAAQGIAVAVSLPLLAFSFGEYSAIATTGVFFLWLWFINLTNFMDGIDGISALQTIAMMTGIVLLHTFAAPLPLWLPLCAAILAASAFGFLRYNLSPARLFMGDVGSIPLGFLSGYLLLSLAAYGFWAAAMLLPAYYLTDATLTLLRRAGRGEKVWQAHSQHAYQQAVRGGLSHNQVVGRITLLNALLVMLALVSTRSMMAGVFTCAAGYALALYLFRHLTHASLRR